MEEEEEEAEVIDNDIGFLYFINYKIIIDKYRSFI